MEVDDRRAGKGVDERSELRRVGGRLEQPPSTVEDSAENDTPPEPGSPEDAFEQECEKHPERCG